MMMSRSRQIYARAALLRRYCMVADAASDAEAVAEVAPPLTKGGNNQTLYWRLSALRDTDVKTVAKTLNQYIREGNRVKKLELDRCIKELRKYKKHRCALEIIEWMEMRNYNFSHADHAIRLDLISKVQGIDAAEIYFSRLLPSYKNQYTYGALLNCYCKEKVTDKALALFQKMDKLGFATSLAYNNLMSLYMRLSQPEKIPSLVQYMKKRNIPLSTFTYNIWMNSYSSLNDIEGAERVFEEITQDNERKCDWSTYSNMAGVYVKAGEHEKAESALKKLEEEMEPDNREAFHFLISFYAGISNRREVHRIWRCLKSNLRITTNMSYHVMMHALDNLDDIDMLKKCFQEWEFDSSRFYEMGLAKCVIRAYLRHDMVEEAKLVLKKANKRSSKPCTPLWEMFMVYYLEYHQMSEALKCLEVVVSEVEDKKWHPTPETVNKLKKYLEEKKDVDGAEKICTILKKANHLGHMAYSVLLQTYITAGETAPEMRQRIEADEIELDSELESLLSRVCQ